MWPFGYKMSSLRIFILFLCGHSDLSSSFSPVVVNIQEFLKYHIQENRMDGRTTRKSHKNYNQWVY